MRKNLSFYLYPKRKSAWRWHVDWLLDRKPVWNGRRIVVVAKDQETDPIEKVFEALLPLEAEIVIRPNDPKLFEVAHFLEPLDMLQSVNPDEATFYAHTKGTTRTGKELEYVLDWCSAMYTLNLSAAVDRLLPKYPAIGCFRTRMEDHGGSDWHFAGTYFWFRHDALFSRGWRDVHNDRWAAEGYPGRHFSFKESVDLVVEKDPWTPGALYCGSVKKRIPHWISKLETVT